MVICAIIFLGISFLGQTEQSILINNEAPIPFLSGWEYSLNNVYGGKLPPLPAHISAEAGDRIVVRNTLPASYVEGMTLCFRSVHQYVRVLVNGEELYQFGYDVVPIFGKSPGNAWNFIRLSKDTAGGILEIELVSPYKDYSARINVMQYGSKNSNVFHILSNNLLAFVLSLFILLFGFLLLMAHLFFRRHVRSESLLFLGQFALLAGLWSLTETRFLQFISNQAFAFHILAIVLLMLLPVPFLLFIAETHNLKNRKLLYSICIFSLAALGVSCLLQVFGLRDLVEVLPYLHGVLGVSMVGILGIIAAETILHKNKNMHVMGIGCCIFLLISSLDFLQLYRRFTGDSAFFFRLGVLFYILILSYHTIRQLLSILSQDLHTQTLEKLVYLDLPTDLQNRSAFERDMEKYKASLDACQGLTLALFDLNNLKAVNDTLGHKAGDDLILAAANCLRKGFPKADGLYRIGGDEFVMLCHNFSETEVLEMLRDFHTASNQYNLHSDAPLSVAHGIAHFSHLLDRSADGLFIRADEYMYEQKLRMKGGTARRKTDLPPTTEENKPHEV